MIDQSPRHKDLIRIAHVLASIDDPAAGPSQSVPALASALAQDGIDVSIHALRNWRANDGETLSVPGVIVERHPIARSPLGRFMAASASLRTSIDREAATCHVIHTHGLWLAPNLYPSTAIGRPVARAKLVLSPRGMLGPAALAISPRRKRLVWALAQRRAVASAHCIHATAESELTEIRDLGLTNPVAVIPNGIALPPQRPQAARTENTRVVLSLGRLHPKKGLDRLISAWALVEQLFPAWRLKIVGRSENSYAEELKALARKLKVERVSIEGPLYGRDKSLAYWRSDVFALPSLNENFAMTVAEALAHGVPVISSKGAPWSGLVRERCGWWVDGAPANLAQALKDAMSLSDSERSDMGQRGRRWMGQDFSWSSVATRMADVYRWLAFNGPRPHTIDT